MIKHLLGPWGRERVLNQRGACLAIDRMLPEVQITWHWAGICRGVFIRSSCLGQVILKIVTPYFNRPNLLCMSLVSRIVLKELKLFDKPVTCDVAMCITFI